MTIYEEIRNYIACPELGDDHYGKWGALNLRQRLKIKELCDCCKMLEEFADEIMIELKKGTLK